MKKFIAKTLVLSMVFTMCGTAVVKGNTVQAAKKNALSAKKVTLNVGKTKTIKLTGAKKATKIKWKSSNKKVAKVTKAGKYGAKIKALKKGTAKVTCSYKVKKKNYSLKCTVTVKSVKKTVPSKKPTVAPTVAPTTAPTKAPEKTPSPTPVVESIWKEFTQCKVEYNDYCAGFLDKKIGLLAGYAGDIHYTTDGGGRWEKATNNSMCRWGLEIVNENVFYTCGNGGDVTKSVDGGKTFTKVTPYGKSEPNQCRIMSFIDENTGLIAAGRDMAITTDGGKSWTPIAISGTIVAARMKSASNFCYLTNDFTLHVTKDGGANWETTTVNLPEGNYYTTILKYAISMDGDNAYTIYCFSKDNQQLMCFETKDSGATVNKIDMPTTKAVGDLYLNNAGNVLTMYGSNNLVAWTK